MESAIDQAQVRQALRRIMTSGRNWNRSEPVAKLTGSRIMPEAVSRLFIFMIGSLVLMHANAKLPSQIEYDAPR